MGLKKIFKKIFKTNSSVNNFKLSKPLKIGIFGAGAQATLLAKQVISAGAKIEVIHDIKIDAAKKLALMTNTKNCTNKIEDFFKFSMDGVLISTIPTVRTEPIKQACDKKINIFVEKPPAYDLKMGRECLNYIKNSGIISSVGFQSRYDPRYEKLKKLIEGKEIHLVRTKLTIGYYPVIQVPEWYLQKKISGGPYAEQAIHLLDCVRYILNNPKPIRAASMGVKNMVNYNNNIDAENSLQLIYELDNGIFGSHTNHCGHDVTKWDLELIGPNLRLEANATEKVIKGTFQGKKLNEKFGPNNDLGGLDKISAWLKSIEENNKSYIRSSYEESLNTQALIEAAIKSQNSNKMELAEKI